MRGYVVWLPQHRRICEYSVCDRLGGYNDGPEWHHSEIPLSLTRGGEASFPTDRIDQEAVHRVTAGRVADFKQTQRLES